VTLITGRSPGSLNLPGESAESSGDTVRRSHIARTGNAHLRTQLVESVLPYRPALPRGHFAPPPGRPATVARSWTAAIGGGGTHRISARFFPTTTATPRRRGWQNRTGAPADHHVMCIT